MNPIMECKALTKKYGLVNALDSVDFTVERDRIIGLHYANQIK